MPRPKGLRAGSGGEMEYMKKVWNLSAKERLRVRGAVVLLILCLLIMPVTAAGLSASPPPGSGSEDDPYLLSSADHFLWMADQTAGGETFLGKYFRITDTIDCTGTALTPVGNDSTPFMGIVEGGGYSVENLTMENQSGVFQGLFGVLDSAVVTNISLANCSIHGSVMVGSLAGRADASTIINVWADKGTVVKGTYHVGGLIGGAADTIIAGGTSHATVCASGIGTENGLGGLVGFVWGNSIIGQSCTDGEVLAPNATAVGGLVGGDNGDTLYLNSYAAGNITGRASVGGLIGESLGTLTIARCYASGNVSGQEYVGGLIGGTSTGNSNKIMVSESVAVNPLVSGSTETTHRIAGGFGNAERFHTDTVYARDDMRVNGVTGSDSSAYNGISVLFADLTPEFYRDTLHWSISTSGSAIWRAGTPPYLNRYDTVPPVYLTITQPSVNETILAEGRDFYVWGNFTNPSDIPVNIRISLANETGTVRMVKSTVNASGVTASEDVDMSKITDPYYTWGGLLAPDLIIHPGGYENAENKLLVNKTLAYYHGMIQGGATRDMGTYNVYDADGNLNEIDGILTAGTYTVIVEAFDIYGNPVQMYNDSGEELFWNQTVDLTFGLTNASLGLFRPENTKQKLIEYAQNNNRRTYFDWFPGYFQMENGNAGYEIRDRWQPNNAIEVVNYLEGTVLDNPATANNTLTLYHIGQKPATYQVELSGILEHADVDASLLTFLYYDIGEPDVRWRNAATGEVETRSGVLMPLPDVAGGPDDARIHYTHADISAQRNVLSPGNLSLEQLRNESIDLRADDTPYRVEIIQGENVIFYGVTRPISSAVEPIETARGIPQDQILSFTYTNDTLGTFTFPGRLNRTFIGGFTEPDTNYEFGHLFNASVTSEFPAGEWVFTVTGYNKTGALVGQTEAELTLNVIGCTVYDTLITGTSTGDQNVSVNKIQLYSPDGGLADLEMAIADASRTPVQDGYHVAVLKGFDISITSGIPEGTEAGGWIFFNITGDDLARYQTQPSDIYVLHYTGGIWEKLHTEVVDISTDPVQFRAKTHSFSDFAVVMSVPSNPDNGGADDGLELLASVQIPAPTPSPVETRMPATLETSLPPQETPLPVTEKPTGSPTAETPQAENTARPTTPEATFPVICVGIGLAAGYRMVRKH